MDPARMFKESLTSRPELENSQGQKLKGSRRLYFVRFAAKSGHRYSQKNALTALRFRESIRPFPHPRHGFAPNAIVSDALPAKASPRPSY